MLQGYSYGSLIASLHPVLSDVRTSHILLSYPLGPRSWLTAFHSSRYQTALQDLVRAPDANVLVLYGDRDDFTSAGTYDAWADALGSANQESEQAKLQVVKVPGASHFWREDEAVEQLLVTIQAWLRGE